jgi:hypothetical protein
VIPIEHPPEAEGLEPCALCGRPTALWTALPDRQAKDQVACCSACGAVGRPADVPSKAEWFKRNLRRSR